MITVEEAVGWSALLGAGATVVGAITLMVFFARGNPWGTWNDVATIVVMLATIPVALLIATLESEQFATFAWIVGAVGVLGMWLAATFQAFLVLGRRTYRELLGRTLASSAVVGLWYLLMGMLALARGLGDPLPQLAIASGTGFLAVAYGFAVGDQHHLLSKVGAVLLFGASTAFLGILGGRLVSGDLVIPTWNA